MDSIYKQLIKTLKQKSEEGLVIWTKSTYKDTYQANVGTGVVMVMVNQDYNPVSFASGQQPIASLSFLNERGEKFKTIICLTELDEHFKEIEALYDLAESSYLQVDSTLQSMLDDLNER